MKKESQFVIIGFKEAMKVNIQDHPKLYTKSPLDDFLSIPPYDPEAEKRARRQLEGKQYPRKDVSEQLYRYNVAIGNDSTALHNIEKLNDPEAVCVVTGQQLGFMGGPAYTILKALSCLLLARQTKSIPIFWLATEDHDVAEIDHAVLIDSLGNLKSFHLTLPKDGRCVEDLFLTPQHFEVMDSFLQTVGKTNLLYRGETSYAKLMARFLADLFVGTGLVFLEPYLLRSLATPFFKKEVRQCRQIQQTINKTTQDYEAAGGVPLLKMHEGTNLFLKVNGFRRKIVYSDNGFLVGSQRYSENDLLKLIDENPQNFSTNVAARPVLQSLLLPTLAYVAGPNELAYYRQLKDYHCLHGVAMPWIVPRLSATLVSPYASQLLEKCHLDPWDIIPRHWTEIFPEVGLELERLSQEWQNAASKECHEDISIEALHRFVRHCLHNLQRKVIKSRVKSLGLPHQALHFLHNLIHPREKLQERILNWYAFQATSQENLIQAFLEHADWRSQGHLYCFLK